MESTVLDLKRALQNALDKGKTQAACDILDRLQEVKATKDLLKKTEIGIFVTKLKRHRDAGVVQRATKALDRWKRDVGIAPKPATAAPPPPAAGANGAAARKPPSRANSTSSTGGAGAGAGSESGRNSPGGAAAAAAGGTETPRSAVSSDAGSSATSGGGGGGGGGEGGFRERSVALDGVSLPSLGDKVREKCVELMYNALCVESPASSADLARVAAHIELALYRKHKAAVSPEYKTDLRMYSSSIKNKRNGALRASLAAGDLDAAALVEMSAAELAPGEVRAQLEEARKKNLFLAQGATNVKAVTDQFRCGKCKKRRCSYFQMQTRSADEPMTTFVECLECGNNWKFC